MSLNVESPLVEAYHWHLLLLDDMVLITLGFSVNLSTCFLSLLYLSKDYCCRTTYFRGNPHIILKIFSV